MFLLAASGGVIFLIKENASNLWAQISVLEWNYFYSLLAISLIVYSLEIITPWRKGQNKIRRDFWLDSFYMFFNIFLFPMFILSVLGVYLETYVKAFLENVGAGFLIADRVADLPWWLQLVILFIARDFIQWNIHRLLHKSDFLWQFHKVHHSVKEMGFAAHLRFHWMESVIYNTIQYLPLAMIGFALNQYISVYVISILIGHLNHANLSFSYGPFRYVLNNPYMHIWHHAKELPERFKKGCNFGLSLSVWDYLFKTSYIPENGRDEELGYDGEEDMPDSFIGQLVVGLKKKKKQPPDGG